MRVGFHISILGSIDKAVDRALAMGINTFQMFTRNPRSWQLKPLDPEGVVLFTTKLRQADIRPVCVHMPYLPNLASPRREVYNLSVQSLIIELKRCNELNVSFLVTHLGSHLGSGKAMGLKRIIEAINSAFLEVEDATMLLFENTSGTQNNVGSVFEDLKKVVDGITENKRVGICFDTCHAFAAGYDLRGREPVENTLSRLDSVLGLDRLKLVHLNDSVGGLCSHLDRHEHIGLGQIGEKGVRAIINSEFSRYPIIMETPVNGRRTDFDNLIKFIELTQQ